MKYFVTAIGTDSGKTLISAILAEAFGMDYWKPIQAGAPGDTETIRNLVSTSSIQFHPERYFLKMPASPHDAARAEGIEIDLEDFKLPNTENLLVEGAGGLLVPINDEVTMLDLVKHLGLPVIVVSNLYLGSINHSLLTVEELKRHEVPVRGIIFNGEVNKESERIIEKKSGWEVLMRLRPQRRVDRETVKQLAGELRNNIDQL